MRNHDFPHDDGVRRLHRYLVFMAESNLEPKGHTVVILEVLMRIVQRWLVYLGSGIMQN